MIRLTQWPRDRLGANTRIYPPSLMFAFVWYSTFRHDLKIKTSDEGRVMKTAAAFAKGFLELEGDLTPILVSLVSKESSKNSSVMMLDPSGNKDITKDMDLR